MAVISGQNLSCVKQERTLFERLSFSVSRSEILHVSGPNGAGKTSLLRILVGLAEPESGNVLFEQQNIRDCADSFYSHLVYFGHRLGLNLSLNPLENLTFWCQLNGIKAEQQHLYELLAKLGLVGLEDLPVAGLSAGQQRRVALARLWLKTNAKVWVLDEPFTALDVQGIAFLKAHMVEHLGEGGCIITTSHQQLELGYPVKTMTLEYQI